MDLKSQALKGVSWVFIGNFTNSISGFIKIIILTNFLNPSDFGLFAIVNIVIGFSAIFLDVGFSVAILHKNKLTPLEFSSLYWTNFIFCSFIFIIVYFSSGIFAEYYGKIELKNLIIISAIGIVFSALGKLFRVQEEKKMNFKFITIIDVCAAIASTLVAVYFAYFDYGVISLVYSSLFFIVSSNVGFFVYGLYKRKNNLLLFSLNSIREYFNLGLFYTLEQTVNYMSKEIDVLIIGKFYSIEILGFYSLAKQLVLKPFSIINPIFVKVCTPVFALMQNNKLNLSNGYCKLITTISALNLPIYFILFCFAKPIILFLYGAEFIDSYLYLRLLIVYVIIIAFRNPLGTLIVSTGNTFLGFIWTLVTLSLTSLGLYVTYDLSVDWIILSFVITQIFLYIPMFYFIIKPITNMSLSKFISSHIPNYKWVFSSIINRNLIK